MLLCLCLLTLFALPMETAAHPNHRTQGDPDTVPTTDKSTNAALDKGNDYEVDETLNLDPSDIIHWVRVYKNPIVR